MSKELATENDLLGFDTPKDGERVYVSIHKGKNVEKTMALVGLIYHFKSNFRSGPVSDIADTLDADIDTNCRILPSNRPGFFEQGHRIFDLACAYAPEQLVSAMMKHPDTPVGEVHGFYHRHSALTFLAQTIVGWTDIKAHEDFDNYAVARRSTFRTLIEDPRTPVNFRTDLHNGGETLDVLGVLTRDSKGNGLAYHPVVSEYLWQRKALIATHYDFKDEMTAAWAAASNELVKDACFKRMDEKEKKKFQKNLQQDIDNQYVRTGLRAYRVSYISGPGPEPLSGDRLDPRQITHDTKVINPKEAVAAKTSIAREIWMDCASLACFKNGLLDALGRVQPDLYRYAGFIDEALKPKPQQPALGSTAAHKLSKPGNGD